jgi:hypothetical protein
MENQISSERRPVLDSDNSVLFYKTYRSLSLYADKTMPEDLKSAGFKSVIFVSNTLLNGSKYCRYSYQK